jgi:hypothetical protein
MSNWVYVWFALTMTAVVWYSSITVYVAIRGAFDIKEMFARLDELKNELPAE